MSYRLDRLRSRDIIGRPIDHYRITTPHRELSFSVTSPPRGPFCTEGADYDLTSANSLDDYEAIIREEIPGTPLPNAPHPPPPAIRTDP